MIFLSILIHLYQLFGFCFLTAGSAVSEVSVTVLSFRVTNFDQTQVHTPVCLPCSDLINAHS